MIMNKEEVTTIEQLLDRIEKTHADDGRVSLGAVLDSVGRRSFGPLLLLAGLITLAPVVGDIPGMPSIMGVFVILTAGQLLFNQEHFWLPRWMLNRTVPQDKLCRSIKWIRKPGKFLDRWTQKRLPILISGPAIYIIAMFCITTGLAMPVMEVVPFSANGAGLALSAFGLALIAQDGLLALFAFGITAVTAGAVVYGLLM
ncbi:MAG: exopolysaccharide biosynthesis protein [Desulfovibrionales bacterium]